MESVKQGLERLARDVVENQPAESIGDLERLDAVDLATEVESDDLADLLTDFLVEAIEDAIQGRIDDIADVRAYERDLL